MGASGILTCLICILVAPEADVYELFLYNSYRRREKVSPSKCLKPVYFPRLQQINPSPQMFLDNGTFLSSSLEKLRDSLSRHNYVLNDGYQNNEDAGCTPHVPSLAGGEGRSTRNTDPSALEVFTWRGYLAGIPCNIWSESIRNIVPVPRHQNP